MKVNEYKKVTQLSACSPRTTDCVLFGLRLGTLVELNDRRVGRLRY